MPRAHRPFRFAGFDRSDPFDRVLSLDRRHARVGPWLGLMAAVCVHAVAAVAGAAQLGGMIDERPAGPLQAELWEMHDVDLEPPAPAPPAPEPEPEGEPTAERLARTATAPAEAPDPQPAAAANEPPPAAAQAGAVLTAEPDPDEPLDLTGEGFVSGDSARYAGGVTAARGTAQTAVRNPNARPGGVIGGRGKAPAATGRPSAPRPSGPDRSRPARPISTSWSCGFPASANAAAIDFARVRLIVTVGPDGRARSVAVQSDPGHGFGTLARQCAFGRRYQVGLDSAGRPQASTTPPFWVTFTR